MILNAHYTCYPLIRGVCKKDFKMKVINEGDPDVDFDLLWADHAIPNDRLLRFKPHQRCSQLPGNGCITRKNCLAANLNIMRKKYAIEYEFFPRTY